MVQPDSKRLVTYAAGDGRYRGKVNYLDAMDATYGAVGDGVADDTTALQNAAAAAKSAGIPLVLRPGKTFKVNGTIEVASISARGAVLRTTNTSLSPVLRVGSRTAYTRGIVAELPDVWQDGKTAPGWSGLDTGVEVINLLESRVYTGRIAKFSVNLRMNGTSGFSNAYNEVHIGFLNNGKINLLLHPEGDSAWVNQNTFIGGRWDHSTATEGTNIAGARHVAIRANATTTASVPDNNQFYGSCFEGDGPEYHLETMGQYTAFRDCRWETNTVSPKVWWNSTKTGGIGASRNIIDGGYYASAIVQTSAAEASLNVVRSQNWSLGVDYNNGTISWGPGGAGPYDVTLARTGASTLSLKSGTGNLALGQIAMANNNSLYCAADSLAAYLKPGLSAGMTIGRSKADAVTAVTSENANASSTGRIHEFKSSAGVVAWVGLKGAIGSGSSTTANRPAASSVGVGARFYDTTLSKPIWSDGTTWRDATGAAV